MIFSCHRSTLVLMVAGLLAGACDTDIFAARKPPPLPGDRISIMSQQQSIEPDRGLADLAVRLPPATANIEWPQAGGPPNHLVQHLAIGAAPREIWRASIGEGVSTETRLTASPVIGGGRIFTMDSETTVSGFDANTGRRLWTFDVTPRDHGTGGQGGGVAFDGGRVYVATGYAQVLVLDAASGKEVWRQPVSAPVRTAPTVSGGRVFAVSIDNQLHTFDAGDGRKQWTHTGIVEVAGVFGGASPAVEGGIVVVAYSSGEIFALRVENGRVLWSDSLAGDRRANAAASFSNIRAHPVIDRDLVLAISHGGRMAAISLRTGNRVWDHTLAGIHTPWVAGDFIFVVGVDGELVCLTRREGRVRWVTQLRRYRDENDKSTRIIWTGPLLMGGRLLLTNSLGEAVWVAPESGAIVGRQALPDATMVSPVAANGTLYVITDNADLVALR